jgi:hypothetical protein
MEGSCEHDDEPLGSLKILGISQVAASQKRLSSIRLASDDVGNHILLGNKSINMPPHVTTIHTIKNVS